MFRFVSHLGIFLTALVLPLTSCAPAAPVAAAGAVSSAVQETAPSVHLSEVPLLSSIPAMLPEPEPRPVLTQEDIDQALAEVMENYSAAAVSVATVERGQVSQAGVWGWAVKGEREMTVDTKIRAASISKVVDAMCAMAMAEDGILDLDAPLSEYWGAGVVNPYSKGQPTVRTLMTHTSSVKDLETTRGLSHLTALLQSPSSWRSMEPGNGGYWYYSNFGMCVMGTTLELASGGLLENYLQQRFLQPLGADASFFSETLDTNLLATLYTPGGVGRSVQEQASQITPTQIGQSASYFPGGYTTSAVDLAKLVAVLANDGVYKEPVSGYILTEPAEGEGSAAYSILKVMEDQYTEIRLLSEESVEAMETPYFTVDPVTTSPFEQCLILRRQEDILGQEVLYYHTGSAYGEFNVISYNPVTKNGVVVLTTGTPRNMNERGLYALCADLSEKLYTKMDTANLA